MDNHNRSLNCDPRLSLVFCCLCLPFPSLSFLSVSPPILPSCSSYFSLLPGARRSVPDGNSLRLQEPPWRPHGGGTGGEQSGPVLPCNPSPLVLFFPSFSLTLVSSLSVSSVSSLPGYTGPQGDLLLARVPQHRALSSPLLSSPTAPPLLPSTPPFTPIATPHLPPLHSALLLPSPALSPGGRR